MQPMLATPGPLPEGADWLFEVRWGGLRLLADVADGVVRLTGSDGRDVTGLLPELDEIARLAPDVLLDGEAVVLADGVPSPEALATRLRGEAGRRAVFLVSDVLRLYGVGLADRPLEERRGTLERLAFTRASAVRVSPTYTDGPALLAAATQRGMAGVVAKRRGGPYRAGGPSPDWVSVTAPHRRGP